MVNNEQRVGVHTVVLLISGDHDETVQVLTRFLEASQQHIPFLLRKAERVEDYLQQR